MTQTLYCRLNGLYQSSQVLDSSNRRIDTFVLNAHKIILEYKSNTFLAKRLQGSATLPVMLNRLEASCSNLVHQSENILDVTLSNARQFNKLIDASYLLSNYDLFSPSPNLELEQKAHLAFDQVTKLEFYLNVASLRKSA